MVTELAVKKSVGLPEFFNPRVSSFVRTSSPMIHVFLSVACDDIAEKARPASMWPMHENVNGNILLKAEILELICTSREGL